jgi:mRNA-degrading endonuclease YafQ of YafQ-DinJ toxin-antitoxin module
MGKKSLIPQAAKVEPAQPAVPITFSVGPEFAGTFKDFKKAGMGDRITKNLDRFKTAKQDNPLSPFGSSDKPFISDGHFSGLNHAHLTHNISLVYRWDKLSRQIKLYGFYTHDDLGTGSPPNFRKQSTVGPRLKGQVFENR